MFNVYQSNRMEVLVDRLAEVVSTPLANPFAPETIIVQSRGMERWLAMQLADRLGIWANAAYPFPQKFIWDVFRDSFGSLPDSSAYDWANLEWKLMQILPSYLSYNEFAPIRRYLKDDQDDLKRFQLAARIARTLDQYVIYRPKLLQEWEAALQIKSKNKNQLDLFETQLPHANWQAILWRDLVKETDSPHRAALRETFLKLPDEKKAVPERVTLFGLSSIAPFHLDVLDQLSNLTEIHLFSMSPCKEYWADIRGRRFMRKMRLEGLDESEMHFEQGNELLASLGGQGGDFQYCLQNCGNIHEEDLFEAPTETNTLGQLHHDIYNLSPQRKSYLLDESVQFHSCHSPMREVETLADRLTDILEQHPELEPRDVLVMAPDIEHYAQAIEAVFGTDIPHSVADRSPRMVNEASEALISLIDILQSRFEAARVLEFLEHRLIQKRFGFEENDLTQIRKWAENLNIRWGRDEKHRADLHLPSFHESSWDHALTRLITGFMIGGEEPSFFQQVLTEPDIEGEMAELLGRLMECLQWLFRSAERIESKQSAEAWEKLLLDFLRGREEDSDPEIARDWVSVSELFRQLKERHEIAEYSRPIPIDVLKHWLIREMEENRSDSPFLGGGVTCCNLVPMRSIPFRVVCLLGMNDGAYPRIQKPVSFDLLAIGQSERGDRSRREDDRYLFLEALLSARDIFYISFVGQSIRDNAEIPPSVLVSELLDQLGDMSRDRVLKHPLQAFSPVLFQPEAEQDKPAVMQRFSYSKTHCLAAETLLQEDKLPCEPLLTTPWEAEEIREVDLDDFCRFFESPAAWFMRKSGFHFVEANDTLDDRIPQIPDSLMNYQLRQAFLLDPAAAIKETRERGFLPPGQTGKRHSQVMEREAISFRRKLDPFQEGQAKTVDIDLDLHGLRITGQIHDVYENHALAWRFGSWQKKHEMTSWVRHLLLIASTQKKSFSTVIIASNISAKGKKISAWKEGPEELLKPLIETFLAGQISPLPFFPATSNAWMRKFFSTDNLSPEDALAAARGAWLGYASFIGDRDQYPAHQFLYRDVEPFDDEFKRLAALLAPPNWKYKTKLA